MELKESVQPGVLKTKINIIRRLGKLLLIVCLHRQFSKIIWAGRLQIPYCQITHIKPLIYPEMGNG